METTKNIEYFPCGVCSKKIDITITPEGIVEKASFTGGCSGNLQGITSLTSGLSINKIIERLEGIDCGGKGTSCPDQLAHALKKYLSGE
ncbi:MAG: TIGR03905 family TSCPD domain-containing protein [Rikenellaceae bacterium]|nr:TIGR03905 family TSCPD domain-containing protein [Rikenellaceae bacterium]